VISSEPAAAKEEPADLNGDAPSEMAVYTGQPEQAEDNQIVLEQNALKDAKVKKVLLRGAIKVMSILILNPAASHGNPGPDGPSISCHTLLLQIII